MTDKLYSCQQKLEKTATLIARVTSMMAALANAKEEEAATNIFDWLPVVCCDSAAVQTVLVGAFASPCPIS